MYVNSFVLVIAFSDSGTVKTESIFLTVSIDVIISCFCFVDAVSMGRVEGFTFVITVSFFTEESTEIVCGLCNLFLGAIEQIPRSENKTANKTTINIFIIFLINFFFKY